MSNSGTPTERRPAAIRGACVMKKYYLARGNVQGVMFRQTLIRAAQKRNLSAGATNLPGGREVVITLDGAEAAIEEMIETARSLKPLNSWGAAVDELVEQKSGRELNEHQVTTENVDDFSWNPEINMFL
jgi:acylphosphatase